MTQKVGTQDLLMLCNHADLFTSRYAGKAFVYFIKEFSSYAISVITSKFSFVQLKKMHLRALWFNRVMQRPEVASAVSCLPLHR